MLSRVIELIKSVRLAGVKPHGVMAVQSNVRLSVLRSVPVAVPRDCTLNVPVPFTLMNNSPRAEEELAPVLPKKYLVEVVTPAWVTVTAPEARVAVPVARVVKAVPLVPNLLDEVVVTDCPVIVPGIEIAPFPLIVTAAPPVRPRFKKLAVALEKTP